MYEGERRRINRLSGFPSNVAQALLLEYAGRSACATLEYVSLALSKFLMDCSSACGYVNMHMITIENDAYRVGIREAGAELCSFQSKATGQEWIWQADPAVWGSSAPILFPIVGFLKDGKTRIGDQDYEISKHGVLRNRACEVIDHQADQVTVRFTSDEETLKIYPYAFEVDVCFSLEGSAVSVDYQIRNTGSDPMLFSLGSHPAIALDLETSTLTDYSIQFEQPESLDLYGLDDTLLVQKRAGYLTEETAIELTGSIFEDDALIFKDVRSRRVSLHHAQQGRLLEMYLRDAPHLAFWAKPGAPFVCIEPWFTYNDAPDSTGVFAEKPGVMTLGSEEMFGSGYSLRIL